MRSPRIERLPSQKKEKSIRFSKPLLKLVIMLKMYFRVRLEKYFYTMRKETTLMTNLPLKLLMQVPQRNQGD